MMAARQAQAPVRKLTIKPLRAVTIPPDFEETTWQRLETAVAAVHAKAPVAASLEQLYRSVEDLCAHKLATTTYDRLRTQCDAHIRQSLEALRHAPVDPSVFLPRLHAVWQDHCEQTLLIRAIFLCLDRSYPLQTPGTKPIWELGLQLFRQHLVGIADLLPRCVAGLLALVERERTGDVVERSLLQSLSRMLSALGLYAELFEGPLLDATRAHYTAEGTRVLAVSGVPEYLRHVDVRLAEEGARASQALHASSRRLLLRAVHQTLIAPHTGALLEKGFDALMDEERTEDLRRMHTLFGHVGAHRELKDAWAAYIKRVGTEMVMDTEREKTVVQDMLALKARCDRLHADAFERSEAFGYALREAFEAFVNVRQNRPAELIAKYLDSLLRNGSKGSSDEEVEATLDRTMALFRFINGKDMFEAFFKKDLAKRLLMNKSASVDAEKALISKLKAECGAGFTNKLEGMFRDMDLSADVMAAFRAAQDAGKVPASEVDLTVHVLTTGFWPASPPSELKLPCQLSQLQELFSSFYLGKHTGRRLAWAHSLGHCLVKGTFPLGTHELHLSLHQAVVLMLFNEAEDLGIEDIADATGLEDKELRLTLQSLACGKVRVLTKEPRGRDVEDGDRFTVNEQLSHKLYRIKVNSIQLRESPEENEQTAARVFNDRQYQIDAAIVRIMKSRKTLSHQLLLSELYSQLKFPLKPQDLKKRIESLIDREYLERDASNTQMYRYLA